MGDRHRRRQPDVPRGDGGAQLRPAVPVRLGDLVVVDAQLQARRRPRRGTRASGSAASATAGCPGSGRRPTAMPTSSCTSRTTACSADSPASTKPARIETRVGGQAAFRASRHAVAGVGDQHDHGRVDARELARSPRPVQRRACPDGHRLAGRAAVGAEVMAVVEVGQRDGVGHQPGVAVAEQRAGLAQRRRPDLGPSASAGRAVAGERAAGQRAVDAEVHHAVRRRRRAGTGRRPAPGPGGRRPARRRRRPSRTSGLALLDHQHPGPRARPTPRPARPRRRAALAGPVDARRGPGPAGPSPAGRPVRRPAPSRCGRSPRGRQLPAAAASSSHR